MNYQEDYKNANVKKYQNNPQRDRVLGKQISMEVFKATMPGFFKKGERVLDIAGGPGVHTDILRDLGVVDDVYAIDISPDLIAERNPLDHSTVGDMENLPYEDDFFDKALFIAALHHTNKTKRTLSEAARVTKKGGCVILSEPMSIKMLLRGKDIKPTPDGVEFILSIRYILKSLAEQNLKVEYIRFYGFLAGYVNRVIHNQSIIYQLHRLELLINKVPGLRYVLGYLGNRVMIVARKTE